MIVILAPRTSANTMKNLEGFQAVAGFMGHVAGTVNAFQKIAVWSGAEAYRSSPVRGAVTSVAGTSTLTPTSNRPRPVTDRVRQALSGQVDQSAGAIEPSIVMGPEGTFVSGEAASPVP